MHSMDLYQQYIHMSRYSRWMENLGRRETWEETVQRYIDFFDKKTEKRFTEVLNGRIKQAITNLEVMPSMRCLMTAGEALERENIAAFNCSYLAVNSKRSFAEALYVLMNGTGVGFSCERQEIAKLPAIPDKLTHSDDQIVVGDSKEGWAKAYSRLLSSLWEGDIPKIDYSRVRPAGARLKTFGGRASGPAPLKKLFQYTIETFQKAKGRKLNSLEVHDIMCTVGEVVVVGGVRRSALISLSNLSDQRMRDAKSGQWWVENPQRALANNSVSYTEKPEIEIFMEEWLSLVKSKSGERGIFNRVASAKQAEKWGRRPKDVAWGTNPCSEIILQDKQFCVGGDTPLITKTGIVSIKELRDTEVSVWNGEEWTSVTVRRTGENQQLMRVYLSDGSYLDCTPDHRWSIKTRFDKDWFEVSTENLVEFSDYAIQIEPACVVAPTGGLDMPNAYTLGFAVGDGCVQGDTVWIDLYGEKDCKCPVVGNRHAAVLKEGYNVEHTRVNASKFLVPQMVSDLKIDASSMLSLSRWERHSVLSFVAGLADADGSNTGTGGIRVYLSKEKRARALQLVLTKNGIRSSVCLCAQAGSKTNKGIRKQDLWYLQITDCSAIPCVRLDTSLGHAPRIKGKYQTIVDVVNLSGVHDSYCFNEPKKHKGLFANVLTYQCNLSEVVVRENDTFETLLGKVEIAAILGTFQSTLTNFNFLSEKWKINTEAEALLGVSLTGIMDNPLMSGRKGNAPLKDVLNELRNCARKTNSEWAEKLEVRESAAITCMKPSGTVSQLVNSASGMHARHNRNYIRTVRVDKKDPLYHFMVAKGFVVEDDAMRPDSTAVISFPMSAPDKAVTREEVSALDALNLWLFYQREWCEHKPSVTVTVKDEEWLEVGAWVYKYFDECSGISFLPFSDHTYTQQPFQDISPDEFVQWKKDHPTPEINWQELAEFESADNTVSAQTLACSGSSCELPGT